VCAGREQAEPSEELGLPEVVIGGRRDGAQNAGL